MANLGILDVTAVLRPRRHAVLIPSTAPISTILERLIPSMTITWGGALTFVMPVSPGLGTADPQFSKWAHLLRLFDPDVVVSATDDLPPNLIDAVRASTLVTDEIHPMFGFDPDYPLSEWGAKCQAIWRPTDRLVIAERTGDDILDLWRMSRTGALGAETISQLNSAGFSIDKDDPSRASVSDFVSAFDDYWPLRRSMVSLGTYFRPPTQACVVVGDSVSDWASYQSFQYGRRPSYWFPPALLSRDPKTFDRALRKCLANSRQPALVVSASLAPEALRDVIEASLARSAFTSAPKYVVSSFDEALSGFDTWGEPGNFVETTLVMQDRVSLQVAPHMQPASFEMNPDDAKYLIELSTRSHKFLAHRACAGAPLVWAAPHFTLESDSRRTRNGTVVFNPVGHSRLGGQKLKDILRSPRLRVPSLMEDFSAVAATAQLRPAENDKSMRVRTVVEMWGGDLERFCRETIQADSSVVFRAFKMGKNAKTALLSKAFGIERRGEIFFSLPLQGAFKDAPSSLSDDLVSGWIDGGVLVRGLSLRCSECGTIDFYPMSDVTDRFRCTMCRAGQRVTAHTTRSIEPRFLYRLNPVLSAFFREDSDVAVWGINALRSKRAGAMIEWVTEIDILKSGKVVQEVDLVANIDGELLLGECKSNGALAGDQLTSYVNLCSALRVPRFACITLGQIHEDTRAAINKAFFQSPGTAVEFVTGPG